MLEDKLVQWIVERVNERPGVSVHWPYENRPRMGSETYVEFEAAATFDKCLYRAIKEFELRTTNKVMWPKGYLGHRGEPRRKRDPDPRQLNLVGTGAKK